MENAEGPLCKGNRGKKQPSVGLSRMCTTFSALLTLGAHAQRGLQYLVCHSVCLSVCLSVRHAILAVRATKSITKDTIVLSVRFAAILKWRFS